VRGGGNTGDNQKGESGRKRRRLSTTKEQSPDKEQVRIWGAAFTEELAVSPSSVTATPSIRRPHTPPPATTSLDQHFALGPENTANDEVALLPECTAELIPGVRCLYKGVGFPFRVILFGSAVSYYSLRELDCRFVSSLLWSRSHTSPAAL